MVYKIGNPADLESLPFTDDTTMEILRRHAKTLSVEYGENRNINENDGGYILYATPGTSSAELKAFFDVSKHPPEYVNTYGSLCEAVYLLNNDFSVVIVMSIANAPTEILNEIDK